MTSKGTRLVGPRLAHIAGVDHPAHQEEGWIVAKALGAKPDLSNLLEGLTMTLDVKEIAKSLEAPLTKDNAADVITALTQGVSYLISKSLEDEKPVSKADGVKEATDTNVEHVDTDVTKTKTKTKADDGDGDEMTMAQKAKAWDDAQAKAKTKGADEPDGDEVAKSVEKALDSSPRFVAMSKQLNAYKAKELFDTVETEVKKAAGALQTDISGFVTAVIAAGGTQTAEGKAIIKSLKATAEQLAVGGSFTKEIGANGAVISGDLKGANAHFKAIAKAISDDEKIPMTQALVEAAKRNPELQSTLSGGGN